MSSKKSARKSKKSSLEVELQAGLSTLQARLTTSEKKLARATDRVERWKAEAKAQRKAASAAAARVDKLQRKLDRATAATPSAPVVDAQPDARADASSLSAVDSAATVDTVVPDQSWSVVQLRAEARRRGLVGLSAKPKADLIAALS